jgi:hypothetical protein
MSALGGLMRPVNAVAGKAAKAGKIKSVKLKVKMDTKPTGKPQFTQNQDAQ